MRAQRWTLARWTLAAGLTGAVACAGGEGSGVTTSAPPLTLVTEGATHPTVAVDPGTE
jgi:hypothetical protein